MPTFTDAWGVHIHYEHWRVPEPTAVVQLAHGIGEHIGRYGELIAALNGAGYSVWADDHRGHGQTGFEQHGGDLDRMGRPGPGGMRAAIAAPLLSATWRLAVTASPPSTPARSPSRPCALRQLSWRCWHRPPAASRRSMPG